MKLDDVVPWGRSLDEYRRMFRLSDVELNTRLLGCGDGPASFNAELTAEGGSVVSLDPIYEFSADEIQLRIDRSCEQIVEYAELHSSEFVWSQQIPDPNALRRRRLAAMSRFLKDYSVAANRKRYVAGRLPTLPFPSASFDMALCSHLLFLYSEQRSEQFHLESILEMLRVAKEVRVFPLLELGGKTSRHLESVVSALERLGLRPAISVSDYEFQRGGNQLLTVRP